MEDRCSVIKLTSVALMWLFKWPKYLKNTQPDSIRWANHNKRVARNVSTDWTLSEMCWSQREKTETMKTSCSNHQLLMSHSFKSSAVNTDRMRLDVKKLVVRRCIACSCSWLCCKVSSVMIHWATCCEGFPPRFRTCSSLPVRRCHRYDLLLCARNPTLLRLPCWHCVPDVLCYPLSAENHEISPVRRLWVKERVLQCANVARQSRFFKEETKRKWTYWKVFRGCTTRPYLLWGCELGVKLEFCRTLATLEDSVLCCCSSLISQRVQLSFRKPWTQKGDYVLRWAVCGELSLLYSSCYKCLHAKLFLLVFWWLSKCNPLCSC